MKTQTVARGLAVALAVAACSSSGRVAPGVDASIPVTLSGDSGVLPITDGGIGAPEDASTNPDADDGASDAAPPPIPVLTSVSLLAFVAAIPHGADYDALTAAQSAAIGSAAQAAADGASDAASLAAGVGYQLATLKTSLASYVVLEPTSAAPAGQATLILRSTWTRDLLVEAPHIPYDFQTDTEAAVIFEKVGARGLLIAGAQRCCSTVASGCWPNPQCIAAGTSVESDIAHSIHSAFHAMHVALATGTRTTNAVQLHTNEEPSINGDVLVSNGLLVTSARVEAFVAALGKFDAGVIKTCADPDAGNDTYCGITNAQGILSNGATDACNGYATAPSDRFLHLEQNAGDLTDAGAWGYVVANAVGAAFTK